MAEYEKKVRSLLKENGCTFVRRGKGDHDIWYSSITKVHVTVDTKIKSRHTANAILKQSGIGYRFDDYSVNQLSNEIELLRDNLNDLADPHLEQNQAANDDGLHKTTDAKN